MTNPINLNHHYQSQSENNNNIRDINPNSVRSLLSTANILDLVAQNRFRRLQTFRVAIFPGTANGSTQDANLTLAQFFRNSFSSGTGNGSTRGPNTLSSGNFREASPESPSATRREVPETPTSSLNTLQPLANIAPSLNPNNFPQNSSAFSRTSSYDTPE